MIPEKVSQRVASALPRARGTCVFSHGAGAGVVGGLRESYTGNARAVYEWCLQRGIDAAWLHASKRIDVALGPAHNFRTVRGAVAAMRAAVSMGGSNNGAPWPLLSERTWVVQGWHGTPLKAIGRAWPGSNQRDLVILERPDFFVSAGPEYTRRYMRCYDVGVERFWETGNPRNDVLVRSTAADRQSRQQELQRQPGVPPFSHVVLYAPTWREWLEEPTFLDVSDRNLRDLDRYLETADAVLVLRAHHREAKAAMPLTRSQPRILVSDALDLPWDVNDWLIASDILVTDYSSIFFDYLNLDRPIVHLAPDIDEYGERRGFMVDPFDDFAGPVVTTQARLIEELERAFAEPASDSELRSKQSSVHNPFEDGRAAERVGSRIAELLDAPRSGRH